jgi:O-antigen/teichoic acid export membrane protein
MDSEPEAQRASEDGQSTFRRNTRWMIAGQGLRIGVQAVYFICLARSLGTHQYGAFVSVVALVAVMAPFASLGSGNLLIKNVARNHLSLRECWGNSLLLVGISGLGLSTLAAIGFHWVLPPSIGWPLVVAVSLSDLVAMRIVDVAGQAFQSTKDLRYTAALSLLPSVLRMIGAVVALLVWPHASAQVLAGAYLSASVASALGTVVVVNRRFGTPRFALWRVRKEWVEGLYFAVGLGAQTIYNDMDKMMLARLSTLDSAGIYGAAYRIIDVAFVPVRSVLFAAYPEFFRRGLAGLGECTAYARRQLRKPFYYSLAAFATLVVAAPLVPIVLGADFTSTAAALRWLSILPALKTIHYFMADSLTGAGFQGTRTAAQIAVAVINVGLNLWLIPSYSWLGAAWASIASDGLLIILLFLAIRLLQARKEGGALASAV